MGSKRGEERESLTRVGKVEREKELRTESLKYRTCFYPIDIENIPQSGTKLMEV